MKKKYGIAIWLIVLAMVVLFIDSIYLDRSTGIQKSDVIVMLGGGDEGRMKKAGELYQDGYAPKVLITPVIESSLYSQSTESAIRNGIPEDAIIYEHNATSTYTNATISLDIMDELDYVSAIIVTSDYHMKRSRMIFERKNDGKRLHFVSATKANGDRWFESTNRFRYWRSELIKYWGYVFYMYHFVDLEDEVDGL